MLRASPMSQVAKTRVLWLMGLEQCIAGLDADEGKICPVNPCEPLRPLWERFLRNRRVTGVHRGKTLIMILIPWDLPLLFSSFRPRSLRPLLRMMAHIRSQNPEDDIPGNVRTMVRSAL